VRLTLVSDSHARTIGIRCPFSRWKLREWRVRTATRAGQPTMRSIDVTSCAEPTIVRDSSAA
jgi:hypothetical protein